MREIRQSGSVRGVRRNPYPYRDSSASESESNLADQQAGFGLQSIRVIEAVVACAVAVDVMPFELGVEV